MSYTLNLNDFWEKIVFSENQDFEHKVYILQQFSSKIRKEFFKNNFMPFLKDLLKLHGEIQRSLTTSTIKFPDNTKRILDFSETEILDLLEIAKESFSEILIEGNKRWNILLETLEFSPNKSYGTIKIEMPNSIICLYLNYTIKDDKKFILFKDIREDSTEDWTWKLNWDYDTPKETLKYILKEKIINLDI
jgi:hypothetical protein